LSSVFGSSSASAMNAPKSITGVRLVLYGQPRASLLRASRARGRRSDRKVLAAYPSLNTQHDRALPKTAAIALLQAFPLSYSDSSRQAIDVQVRRSGLAFAIQASHRPLHPVAGHVVRVRDAGGPRRSPPAQGSRFCAAREPAGGERRLGACIRRLAAAEEIELGKDDRRGEAEETGSACIEHDFGLTRERIGRLSWHCARPRARTADEKRLYCSEFTKAEANAL